MADVIYILISLRDNDACNIWIESYETCNIYIDIYLIMMWYLYWFILDNDTRDICIDLYLIMTLVISVLICSAGIGRTGTYIAQGALYKRGKASGKVNLAEYGKAMRSNRMNMVQTYVRFWFRMSIFFGWGWCGGDQRG